MPWRGCGISAYPPIRAADIRRVNIHLVAAAELVSRHRSGRQACHEEASLVALAIGFVLVVLGG